ncbi:hypothetical protein [Streptomyces sp. NPDC013455]
MTVTVTVTVTVGEGLALPLVHALTPAAASSAPAGAMAGRL